MPPFRRLFLTRPAAFLGGTPSGCLQDTSWKGMKPPWYTNEEGHGTPGRTSQMIEGDDQAVKTPEGPFLEAYFVNLRIFIF